MSRVCNSFLFRISLHHTVGKYMLLESEEILAVEILRISKSNIHYKNIVTQELGIIKISETQIPNIGLLDIIFYDTMEECLNAKLNFNS